MAPPKPTKKGLKQGSLFSFFNKKPAVPKATKASTTSSEQTVVATKETPSSKALKPIALGSRIEVFLSDDNEWYGTTVVKRRGDSSFYYLRYDDGEFEWLDLSTERFRAASATTKKKRRIADEDEDEMELDDLNSEEESAYDEEEAAEEDEDLDPTDDWMVSDDDEEVEASGKKKQTPAKRKPSLDTTKNLTPSSKKSASALSRFSAKKVTVTEHKKSSTSNTTPTLGCRSRPKHVTPETSTMSLVPPVQSNASFPRSERPPPFVKNELNVAGSHVHNHLPFLQQPFDSHGRPKDHPDYDPRTLKVNKSDWKKLTGKEMTDAVKQWWDLKSRYFDTVLLFKTGKFYEMFHMDADVGVQHCELSYMKGHLAHAGFPEISYGTMADKLVRAGFKVARVEQTETPEQLKQRKKTSRKGSVPKVVNREVCSVMTIGTRTFCYLDENSNMEGDATADSRVGPLLAIREVLIDLPAEEREEVQPVCEYGVTLVDAVRGSITVGQFADDAIRSRMTTLLTAFPPSEILIQGGPEGASPTLKSLLKSLQNTAQQFFHVEVIRTEESFPPSTALDPDVRQFLERPGALQPWDVQETLAEVHRRGYFPRASKVQQHSTSVSRWPKVLRVAVEGNADLALSSFGAALFYLQRNLIDTEILSMGIVQAYIPPSSSIAPEQERSSQIGLLTSNSEDENGGSSASEDQSPIAFEAMEIDSNNYEDDITNMELDGTTLQNLEILTNSVDYTVTGSLWSKLDYTKTPHGSRLLRAWLLRPLFRKADIERRSEAVQELLSGSAAAALSQARSVLAKCGDIERLLLRIHSMSGVTCQDGSDENRNHPNHRAVLYETKTYTKRKVEDFTKLLNGLKEASQIPELFQGIVPDSGLIRKIIQSKDDGGCFPNICEDLEWFFDNFDCADAKEGQLEPTKGMDTIYDEASENENRIVAELNAYKEDMCSELSPSARTAWTYVNTTRQSKDKFTIELPAKVAVPDDFTMVGKRGKGSKQVNKYRTSVVEELVAELEASYELQDQRKAKIMELIFARFDSKRTVWAAVAHATALLDALGSLALVSTKPGYTRPHILDCSQSDPPSLKIVQGRHPSTENTPSSSEFIPNDISLGGAKNDGDSNPSVLLLSGPNMGVRYLEQNGTVLIVVILLQGKSTLLRQTCLITILAQTSTFDGTAIASATVGHLAQKNQCICLFATHYHSLLEEWSKIPRVALGHMECLVQEEADESRVTFLYTLGSGVCPKSFGINVARLADLPESVLEKAKANSARFEEEMAIISSGSAEQDIDESEILEKVRNLSSWEDMMAWWEELQHQ